MNLAVPASFPHHDDPSIARGPNHTAAVTRLGVLNCPSEKRLAASDEDHEFDAGNSGYGFEGTGSHRDGVFDASGAAVTPAGIADGLSNTVALSGMGRRGGHGRRL